MYIGQSADIEKRWIAHKRELRGNYHTNNHLQSAWNKYGEDIFEFRILEELPNDKDVLHKKEIEYISKYNTFKDAFHYNEAIGGEGTGSGKDHPQYGIPISDEQKKRISIANKGRNIRYGKDNPFFGQKHSMESKMKMSKAHKGKKYTKEEKINFSKVHTSTGIYGLSKKKEQNGFLWSYTFTDENNDKKTFLKSDLVELEEKVKRLNLDWIIIDENKAKEVYKENEIKKTKRKLEKDKYNTGFYNVRKNKEKSIKQDFRWRYYYKENEKNKNISATTLDRLKKKVLDKNLEWKIVDEEKAKKSIKEDKDQQIKIEKNKNYKDNTGFFRVRKTLDKRYVQGFRWKYYYFKEGKQKIISSTDLRKLEQKVKQINEIWEITDEKKAKKSIGENNKYHEK